MTKAHRRAGNVLLGALVAGLVAGLLAAPFTVLTSGYRLDVARLALYLAILAGTWSFLAGVAGQFSFAHVATAALAGYAGVIWSRLLAGRVEWLAGVWPSIAFGALFGLAIGILLGLLLQRLEGAYLALFTIAFAEVARLAVVAESQLTGGRLSLPVTPQLPGPAVTHYFVMLGLLMAILLTVYAVLGSRLGLCLRAMREDHLAAAAMGVNVRALKLLVIAFTSLLISVAGSVYFHTTPRLVPEQLDLILMSQVIAYAVIGGLESPLAASLAAVALSFLLESLRVAQLGVWRLAVFGAVLALTLRFAPNGLFAPVLGFFARARAGEASS